MDWKTYAKHKANKTENLDEIRDQLIKDHMGIAEAYAKRVHGKIKRLVDIEDLKQVAYIGLIRAVKDFGGETSFPVYVYHMAKWELLAYLRQLDPVPREVRKFLAQHQDETEEHEAWKKRLESQNIVPIPLNNTDPIDPSTLEDDRLEEIVEICCKYLRPPQDVAFIFRFLYGLSLKEIGNLLGRSERNVSELQRLSLETLRKHKSQISEHMSNQ